MKIQHFILFILAALSFLLFQNLRFSGHELRRLPNDSLSYAGITVLDLSQRNLNQVPENTYKYYDLAELDLSNNPLTVLDPRIAGLKKLKKLKLNFCNKLDIDQAAEVISRLNVEELEISNSTLTHIPYSLVYCRALKSLSLSGNYIYELPEDFAINARLQQLNLANNQIDSLPNAVSAMKWLTRLDISNNPCLKEDAFCQLISGIDNLQYLKMDGAKKIGNELCRMEKLSALSIANSEATSFPEGFVNLKSIELTNLDRLNYDSFFKAIEKCDSLQSLSLASVYLHKLGSEITSLKNLKTLQVKNSNIKSLPENFQSLKNLEEVRLQLNTGTEQTATIFKTLGACDNLTKLDLSFSSLSTFPDDISALKNIRELNIEGLQLKELPSGIYALQKLQQLNIKGNELPQNSIFMLQDKLKNCDVLNDVPYSVPANLQKELLLTKEAFTINPSKPNTITTMDGSVIKIPANAFADEKGKPVKTDVVVNFQPFYTPAQIYLSGISMNYDSAGTSNTFLSAGMFNITAAAASGKSLNLAKQKKIQVDFQSLNPSRKYNYYSYNTATNSWAYKGTDTAGTKKENKDAPVVMDNPSITFKKRPKAPVMKNSASRQNATVVNYILEEKKGRKKYEFWIERGYASGSIRDEIPAYVDNKSQWIYETDSVGVDFFAHKKTDHNTRRIFGGASKKTKNGKIYCITSNRDYPVAIYVVPDRANDRFNIVFKQNNDSLVLSGYPKYHSQLANRTQENTRKEYEDYLEGVKKRLQQEEKELIAYRKELKKYQEEMKVYREKLKKYYAKEIEAVNNMNVSDDRIARSLLLDGLGTWNCDIINRLPNGQELYVKLYDGNNKEISPKSITLIDQTNNGYGSFTTSKIIIDRFVNNVLIVKIGGEKYGYAKFTVTNKAQTNLDLALNIIDTKTLSMKEFSSKVFN